MENHCKYFEKKRITHYFRAWHNFKSKLELQANTNSFCSRRSFLFLNSSSHSEDFAERRRWRPSLSFISSRQSMSSKQLHIHDLTLISAYSFSGCGGQGDRWRELKVHLYWWALSNTWNCWIPKLYTWINIILCVNYNGININ